jgi:hypothetical protein
MTDAAASRTLTDDVTAPIAARLAAANAAFVRAYPGESASRQPAQVLYVAADAFHAGTATDAGAAALAALAAHAPDGPSLARILGVGIAGEAAAPWYERVVAKLRRAPLEDVRIDFEDGYGVRADAEEDAHAVRAAQAVVDAARAGALPSSYGPRVKPLNEDVRARSIRTTDVFLTALARASGGAPPPGLRLTLAKITVPEQVAAFAEILAALETRLALPARSLVFEIMIEVGQAVIDARGFTCVRALVDAGGGRCIAAHLGTYDYTASLGVTAQHQRMAHPACDFAKHVMQVSLAGTGVEICDGSTIVLPVPPAGATPDEAQAVVEDAWSRHAADVRRSLEQGYYQGWEMHPAHLPSRYGALYAFFLEALPAASRRMRAFLARASYVSEGAGIADDAATGQALLNFFLRGLSCGAITAEEARATGLTPEELAGRSFPRILAGRRKGG